MCSRKFLYPLNRNFLWKVWSWTEISKGVGGRVETEKPSSNLWNNTMWNAVLEFVLLIVVLQTQTRDLGDLNGGVKRMTGVGFWGPLYSYKEGPLPLKHSSWWSDYLITWSLLLNFHYARVANPTSEEVPLDCQNGILLLTTRGKEGGVCSAYLTWRWDGRKGTP